MPSNGEFVFFPQGGSCGFLSPRGVDLSPRSVVALRREDKASRCTRSNKDFTVVTKEGQFLSLVSHCSREGSKRK